MRTLLAMLLFTLSANAQAVGGKVAIGGQAAIGGGPSSVGSFTPVGTPTTGFTGGSVNTIDLTVPSTGSGHLLVLQVETQGSSSGFITSVITGCSTSWVVPVGAQIGSPGALSGAYCLASASGVSSITINFSVTTAYSYVFYEEADTVGHTPSLDPSGGIGTVRNSSMVNPTGVALTLTGTNDAIFQQIVEAGGTVTAISAPYGNFNSLGAPTGWGNVLNSTNGTAPTWTNSTSSSSIGSAMAFAAN
jgi:hypothetical protein